MTPYTMYKCDHEGCEFECRDAHKMMEHEASHFGLSVEELTRYNALKSYVNYTGYLISNNKNEETEQTYDKAIEDLVAFEKEHGMRTLKSVVINAEFKIGEQVKVVGTTKYGAEDMEMISIGTICTVIDITDGEDGVALYKIVPSDRIDAAVYYAYWYLGKDIKKGHYAWVWVED